MTALPKAPVRAAFFTAMSVLVAGCLLGCLAVQAQGLPGATPESVGMSGPRLARIGAAFRKEIDQGNLPGAVLLVARKGKLVYAEALGFQDKAAGKPIAPDSIFRIYSMTKPLVSVAAVMLMEEGRLQLTDPVSKYLPALKSMNVSVAKAEAEFARISYAQVPAEREMTVQDLLRHTAGLAYGEITQNAPVKEALAKAGLYKSTIDFDARDLAPAEKWNASPKYRSRTSPERYGNTAWQAMCSAASWKRLPASGSPTSSTSACSSR